MTSARTRTHESVQLWALLAGVALLVAGNGLQATLLGVRAGLEGMADETVGVVMSAHFAGFVAGSIYAPSLIQRVGHIRAFAALASIASAVALCFAIFATPLAWIALRGLHGACYAGLVIVAESWLNASASRERRGRVLALYMIVMYGSWTASQLFLTLAPADGFVLFCLVSVCLSLALVPITLTEAGIPGVVAATRLKLGRLYALSPLALVGSFVLGLTVSAFFGMAPTFAQSIGLEKDAIAIFVGAMLTGALILQWPLGWLSDRVDRRYVIVGTSAVAAAIAALIAAYPEASPGRLIALSCLLGGATMPAYSLCVAHLNDHIEEDELIAAASGLVLVYGIGSAMGPFAASVVMGSLGPEGLFVFIAVAMVAYAVYSGYRFTQRAAPAPEDKESYTAVPQTSHAALPLHRHGSGKAEGEPAPR
jgi:MFS family permease